MKSRGHFCLIFCLVLLIIPMGVWGSEISTENNNDPKESEWEFLPIIEDEPETGLVLGGVAIFSSNSGEYQFDLAYSNENYLMAGLEMEKYIWDGEALLLMEVRREDWPQKFYGIGMKNALDKGELFTSIQSEFEFGYLWKVKDFYIGPSIYYNRFEIEDKVKDGLLDANERNIYGQNGAKVVGMGIHLTRDKRDSELYPTKGDYFDAQAYVFNDAFGSDLNFSQVNLDYRFFHEIAPQQILGFQGVMVLSNGDVPFQMQPVLGGDSMMRGFEEKFRDDNYLAFQGEYRFPISGSLSGVVFAGIGEVFSKENSFRFDDLKVGGGFGLRYLLDKEEKLNLRLDIAVGDDDTCIMLSYGEAF